MHLIVCVDDNYGLSFFGRRQSMDALLRRKALELTEGAQLYLDGYSAGQFAECSDRLRVVTDPVQQVPPEGWFFLELADPEPLLAHTEKLAVFHWNREYPSDKRFPMDRVTGSASLIRREEFPGKSHDLITLEVYQL